MYRYSTNMLQLHGYSYTSVVLKGKLFGSHKSRTASSSIVTATNLFPTSELSSGLRAARIEKLYTSTA